jgi:predicted RNA-binding protein YlqC (UPF0109 family)
MSDKVQNSSSGTYRAEDLIPAECRDLTLEQVLTLLVVHIVGTPADVLVHVANTDRIKLIEFEVASRDMAQLLGSEGRTVHALRTISKAVLGPLVKKFSYKIGVQVRDDAAARP